jgi:hypothetical protein
MSISQILDSSTIARPPSLFTAPACLEELGIGAGLVHDLFLKHAYNTGNCTLGSIARSLRLSVGLVEPLFHKMKSQQLIEVRGMIGEDFAFVLSQAGKVAALERMQVSRYCGPAPVSLAQYEAAVRSQVARTGLNRERLARLYEDLTLDPDMLERLGPALVAQNSMFLYGPSGTGKSSLAERLLRIFDDRVAVPWAVETDGNIISVFDPAVHRQAVAQRAGDDSRWTFCSRPCIVVGGELVPEMLELQREPEKGHFIAPLHMKANNGIFVIDDFGRQMVKPQDLLNRWIVPLERRMDFLTINGAKIAIPFEVFVVFSTNLTPSELGDEAFLRRIPNKILVDSISADIFDEILRRRLESNGWPAEPGAAEHLRNKCAVLSGCLRPCYPRDLMKIIESIAEFEERPPALTGKDVNRAAALYF